MKNCNMRIVLLLGSLALGERWQSGETAVHFQRSFRLQESFDNEVAEKAWGESPTEPLRFSKVLVPPVLFHIIMFFFASGANEGIAMYCS